jgi:hypothetical protein
LMKRDPSVWLLLGLQILLTLNFLHLDRSADTKINLRPIYWDVISYYAYLPALWIEGDLTLSFVEDAGRADVSLHRHRYWPETTPQGKKVIKTTMGVALMMSPFFGVAHVMASGWGFKADGFSRPYQFAAALAGFSWGSLGLWFLRSWLRAFWGPWTVGWALVVLVGATNLGNYLVYEPAMSHSFSFFWMSVLLWSSHRALHTDKFIPHWLLVVAFAAGILVLIRPTMMIAGLLPLLYGGWSGPAIAWKRLCSQPLYFVGAVLVCIAPMILQAFYWKYVTGQWLYYSYQGERFFWKDPRIPEFLLSYRKGWLLYNPVMALVVMGWLWALVRCCRVGKPWTPAAEPFPLATAVMVVLPTVVYVYSSWWSWWFGGSLGGRVMVEWYPALMPAGIAVVHALFARVHRPMTGLRRIADGFRRWSAALALMSFLGYTVALQYHQSWQYRIALLHWDATGRDWYNAVWWKGNFPPGLDRLAKPPDGNRARLGLDRSAEIWTP